MLKMQCLTTGNLEAATWGQAVPKGKLREGGGGGGGGLFPPGIGDNKLKVVLAALHNAVGEEGIAHIAVHSIPLLCPDTVPCSVDVNATLGAFRAPVCHLQQASSFIF